MWIDTVVSIGKVVVEGRLGAMMGSLIVVAFLWAIALGARAILLALKRRRR